jgi:hypothetical protein
VARRRIPNHRSGWKQKKKSQSKRSVHLGVLLQCLPCYLHTPRQRMPGTNAAWICGVWNNAPAIPLTACIDPDRSALIVALFSTPVKARFPPL